MNIFQLDSDAVTLIGISIIIILLVLNGGGKRKERPRSCWRSASGFIGGLSLIFFFIYLAYPQGRAVQSNPSQAEVEKDSVINSNPAKVYHPPDTLPPEVQDYEDEYKPNRQKRYNVKPIPADTIPPKGVLYDQDIENEVHLAFEPRHFYIQLAAGVSESRMLQAKATLEAKFNKTFYIGFDQQDPEYPYKLLLGPFKDEQSAKEAWPRQKVWVRDLRKIKHLVILTYP